jgi:hypothetical protein
MCQPLMAEGEFALIRQQLERVLSQPSIWPGDHDMYAMLAEAAVQQRDEPALRHYAPLAEAAAMQCDHKLYRAIAHRAWGVAHRLAGQHAESASRLGQAMALFDGLQTRWQIGRTWFELGELALARNDTIGAREHFSQALAVFEEMRAAPDEARTRAALDRLPY